MALKIWREYLAHNRLPVNGRLETTREGEAAKITSIPKILQSLDDFMNTQTQLAREK
jgi:hypothetical protein